MDVLNMFVNRNIVSIDQKATLQAAARLMRDKKIGSLLVIRDGEYVGIFSESDAMRKAVADGISPDKVTVEPLMSSPIITLDIQSSPENANDLMKEKGIRHIAVTEYGKIVGIISVRDLLHYFKVYYDGIGSLLPKKE